MRKYIIDGNNLIGKIKKLFILQKKDPQSSREKLAFMIERYFKEKKVDFSIHFDGYKNLPIKIGKGKIVYSESSKADDKIKEQISRDKNPKNLIVVSSDRNIMDFAKVCSCTTITSEEFVRLLNEKDDNDEEEKIIKSMNNIEEFKKLFNVK